MTDNRKYLSWYDKSAPASIFLSYLPLDSGMVSARRALNILHRMLAKEGYGQVLLCNNSLCEGEGKAGCTGILSLVLAAGRTRIMPITDTQVQCIVRCSIL